MSMRAREGGRYINMIQMLLATDHHRMMRRVCVQSNQEVVCLITYCFLALHLVWRLGRVFSDMQFGFSSFAPPFVRDVQCRWVDEESAETI